jgi:hypothetical protein
MLILKLLLLRLLLLLDILPLDYHLMWGFFPLITLLPIKLQPNSLPHHLLPQ